MEKAYRMLIVDDEEKIRELIKKYALFEGYEVEESGDGMDSMGQVYPPSRRHGRG